MYRFMSNTFDHCPYYRLDERISDCQKTDVRL